MHVYNMSQYIVYKTQQLDLCSSGVSPVVSTSYKSVYKECQRLMSGMFIEPLRERHTTPECGSWYGCFAFRASRYYSALRPWIFHARIYSSTPLLLFTGLETTLRLTCLFSGSSLMHSPVRQNGVGKNVKTVGVK